MTIGAKNGCWSLASMENGLEHLLDPACVAVVGASEDLGKFGGRALHNLIDNGYAGRIIPINRSRDRVRGLKAYRSIGAAPQGIDVAVLAVPSAHVEGVVAECAAAGVKVCIVISAQFAESGPEGAARQDALVETARAAGMRLLGPNCLGLAVPRRALALSPTVVFTAGSGLKSGGVALVSQSGALMTQMYAAALDAGAGFSACVSVGNQADLDLADFLEHFVDDPATRVIACYVEGLMTPRRFADALARARALGKPVVVTKVGRTETGVDVAKSHTASMAGSFAAFEAVCARHRATLFDEAEDMIRAADVLDRCGRARGTRYAVVSGSGGAAALAADKLAQTEFEPACLGQPTMGALENLFAAPQRKLPIDLGSSLLGYGPERAKRVAGALLSDPNVDCVILVMTPQPHLAETVDAFVSAGKTADKPVLTVAQAGFVRNAMAAVLARHDYPVLPQLGTAIACLATFEPSEAVGADIATAGPIHLPERLPGPGRLTETEAKDLLHAAGVRAPKESPARSKDDAIAAAERIGYPVVLKAMSRSLVHKSEVGGVRVGLSDAEAVAAAWDGIAESLARHGYDDFEGCVVAEIVTGVAELIVGARSDPAFGPLVMIGFGGTLVEVIGDARIALAPISADQARAMMRKLKLWPLLDGARGRPAADVGAAAEAASRISRLAAALGERLVELDVNPLIVGQAGAGAVAVDACATLKEAIDDTAREGQGHE